jgi:hypothetical protein
MFNMPSSSNILKPLPLFPAAVQHDIPSTPDSAYSLTDHNGQIPTNTFPGGLLHEEIIWSSELRSLAVGGWTRTAVFIADVLLTLLPLSFLAFAAVAARLDDQPISTWGDKVRQVAKIGPTIFPILFAVVLRRMLRMVALWRAERGAPLGALEELHGSGSIFGVVETQFLLRTCSITGMAIFVLWALSPVGGQASLRLLDVRQRTSVGTRKLWYLSKEAAYHPASSGSTGWSSEKSTVNALYQALLCAPEAIQNSPQDMWGNVKVPYLEKLNASVADPDGWIVVPATNVTYSSLLGFPVSSIARDDDDIVHSSHYAIETQYFTLDCPVLEQRSFDRLINASAYSTTRPCCGVNGCAIVSSPDQTGHESKFGQATFILGTNTNWAKTYADPPASSRDIIWQSVLGSTYTQASCSLGQSHVEANVTCSGGRSNASNQCRVSRMRPSRRPHRPANDTPFENKWTGRNFIDKWPETNLVERPPRYSLTEHYLRSGSQTAAVSRVVVVRLHELLRAVFAQRLTVCWNTFWQAEQATWYNVFKVAWDC